MSVMDDATTCELLHEGGEAFIYKVKAGGKPYILKWYAKNSKFDASVIDKLRSVRIPGIYHVVEAGEKAGRDYLLYDFVDGVSAAELDRLPVAVAISVVRNIAKALAALAKNGVHHGDLNPANVVLGLDGNPTLIDCGIVGPGALAYAALERFQGKTADTQSDIYSLGLLLYRLVVGEDLLVGDSYEGFAQAAAEIDKLDPTTVLYGKGIPAETLSALAPVWKASLRANASERAEDLEEFDEILEIAFNSLSGGSVAWETARADFVQSLVAKNGTKCNDSLSGNVLPPEFVVMKPTKRKKIAVFVGGGVLILLVLVYFFALLPKEPSIDETGEEILLNSRSIDASIGISNDTVDDSAHVSDEILEELPIPERSE